MVKINRNTRNKFVDDKPSTNEHLIKSLRINQSTTTTTSRYSKMPIIKFRSDILKLKTDSGHIKHPLMTLLIFFCCIIFLASHCTGKYLLEFKSIKPQNI